MRRLISTALLICEGATAAFAHGDGSHDSPHQDVTVKVTKLTGNLYLLQGRGGNIAALAGMDGILIVDDDYKVVSEKLRAALKDLGSASPKFILNTHWHGDHTEGNFAFGNESVIIAHENVRKRMLNPPVIFGQATPAYPAMALPVVTYAESVTLHFDGDEVRAVHFPAGHTDGDTVVFFKNANVVHLGDDFFNGRFPFVDLDSGGSVQGLINDLDQLIPMIPAGAQLIPGHGPMATIDDLKAFRQTLVDTSRIVQDAMKKNMTLDEIKKAGLPEKYKEWGSGFIKTDLWIEILYRSYSKK